MGYNRIPAWPARGCESDGNRRRPLLNPRLPVLKSSRSPGQSMSINLPDLNRKGKSQPSTLQKKRDADRRSRTSLLPWLCCTARGPDEFSKRRHGTGIRLFGAFLGAAALTTLVTSPLLALGSGQKTRAGNRQSVAAASTKSVEDKILDYTNEERRKRNLPLLQSSDALRFVARKHSGNMCSTKHFNHESVRFPKGWRHFATRLKRVGIATGGENIGYQTITRSRDLWARKMVQGWMRSPSHRRNILEPRFRYLGVGVRACDNRLGYATQVFSRAHGRVQTKGRMGALDRIRQENRYWKARSVQARRVKR